MGFAEAELINARAMTLFKMVLDFDEAVTDLSWATISRSGEYCMRESIPYIFTVGVIRLLFVACGVWLA